MILWAALAVFAAAALRDLVCRWIDDGWVLALLVLWAAWAFLSGMTGWDALLHVAVGVAAFLLMWGAFVLGGMGGGDVKLAAAVFLWAGPGNALGVAAIVALCGLVLALCCLLADVLLRLPLPRIVAPLVGSFAKDRGVPYGIALSAGGALAVLASMVPGG